MSRIVNAVIALLVICLVVLVEGGIRGGGGGGMGIGGDPSSSKGEEDHERQLQQRQLELSQETSWAVWTGHVEQACYEMWNLKRPEEAVAADGVSAFEKTRLCYTASKAAKSLGWSDEWTNKSTWCDEDSQFIKGGCTAFEQNGDGLFGGGTSTDGDGEQQAESEEPQKVFSESDVTKRWDTETEYEDVTLYGAIYDKLAILG